MNKYWKFLFSTIVITVASSNAYSANSPNIVKSYTNDSVSNSLNISRTDASNIAINFVKFQSENGTPSWEKANRFIQDDVKDLSGNLRAYEIAVYDSAKKPIGYVVVPLNEGFGPVSSFNFEGKSKRQLLESRFNNEWRKTLESNNIPIKRINYVGAENGYIALAMRADEKYKDTEIEGAEYINGYYVFALNYIPGLEKILYKTSEDQMRMKMKMSISFDEIDRNIQEEQSYRQSLIDGTINNKTLFRSTSNSLEDSANINYTFAPYNQVKKLWPHGYCYTGCTPVALGILMQYWDRNGYGNLIGFNDSKKHTDHTDFIPMNTLSDIILKIGTQCKEGDQGSTPYSSTVKIVDYISDRGYDNWEAINSSYSKASNNAWDKLKIEIKEKRPSVAAVAVHGSTKSANHSVVVYSFKDYAGTTLDSFCYSTGWGNNPATDCMTRNTHYGTTVVREKKKVWTPW